MPRFAPTTPRPRSGNAAVLLLLGLALVGGLAAYLMLSAAPAPSPAPVVSGPTASAQPAGPSGSGSPGRATSSGGSTSASSAQAERAPASAGAPDVVRRSNEDPTRFQGTGTLRGTVDSAVGLSFPATWTLVLEPSPTLAGAGRPKAQRLEFTADQRDFTVEDVELGGYAIRAEAAGCNGRSVHVLLERTSSSAYVMLQLTPAGFIEGQLLDGRDLPVEDVAVWLFPGRLGALASLGAVGSEGRETRTSVEGLWRFDDVIDGAYTLVFGSPTAPLVEPATLSFQAPSLTWPSPELPVLTTLQVMIVDGYEQPVQGARVTVTSPALYETTSSATGMAMIPNLPPGTVRLSAEHELFGEGSYVRPLAAGPDGVDGIHVVPLFERP